MSLRGLLAGTTAVAVALGSVLYAFAPGVAHAAGTFTDDDGNIHEASIEAIAAEGITKGCNPPANTLYCPGDPVTRGQMAAFLVRALGLEPPAGPAEPFVDDDDSIFEEDIEALEAAGITKGCNPPTNNRFCPDDHVTRGQMAAFLVRAFAYADDGGGDLFVDDDHSIFEGDIDRLGTAGITKGCNPPANDRFCPDDLVLRDQMASFLARALNLFLDEPPSATTTTTVGDTTTSSSGTDTTSTTMAPPPEPGTGDWVFAYPYPETGVGAESSLVIAGGLPLIASRNNIQNSVSVTDCHDEACSTATNTVVDGPGGPSDRQVGHDPSIGVIGGRGVISYHLFMEPKGLAVARCVNAACTSVAVVEVDTSGDVGRGSSLAILDGAPVIAYEGGVEGPIRFARCADEACSDATIRTIPDSGRQPAVAIWDGLPIIAYYDGGNLEVARCTAPDCTSAVTTVLDQDGDVGERPSIAVVGGVPIISYHDATNGDLKVARCNGTHCDGIPTIRTIASAGGVGSHSSIVAAPDGYAWIAYTDDANGDLEFADCDNATCSTVTTHTVDSAGDVGDFPSMAVLDGLPVISYSDVTAETLKVARAT